MADLKDFVRMCKSNQNGGYCKTTCPFFYCREDDNCILYIAYCTEESEAIIDKWCADHPVKTYKDDFFEKFPKAYKIEDNMPCDCVNSFYGTDFHCDKSCKDCWNQVYKEEER